MTILQKIKELEALITSKGGPGSGPHKKNAVMDAATSKALGQHATEIGNLLHEYNSLDDAKPFQVDYIPEDGKFWLNNARSMGDPNEAHNIEGLKSTLNKWIDAVHTERGTSRKEITFKGGPGSGPKKGASGPMKPSFTSKLTTQHQERGWTQEHHDYVTGAGYKAEKHGTAYVQHHKQSGRSASIQRTDEGSFVTKHYGKNGNELRRVEHKSLSAAVAHNKDHIDGKRILKKYTTKPNRIPVLYD